MCGIIGSKFFKKNPSKQDLIKVENALTKQTHRGPDFELAVAVGNAVLGHNRLAILDLNPRSNQPFQDESKRYSIVFNGEIYNYPDLKNELLKKGYSFRTSSDTEVLLNHLIEFGEKGIDKLNGCFAFGFYDAHEDLLLIARDHLGIKPVLFSMEDDVIHFASEISAFFDLKESIKIDKVALSNLFKFTYIPAPNTILENVHKLLPGHYLKVKGKFMDIIKYWEPDPKIQFEGSEKEAVQTARNIIENAVIKRMEADVPLGTFLSGGIDSSIVSAIAAEHRDGLHTFSIGFADNPYFDESKFSQMVADKIGSIHHALQLKNEQVIGEFSDVLNSFDEPFADSSAIAMYFLSKGAKEQLTVCLSGDGADELLAGYNKHKAFVKSQNTNFGIKSIAKLAALSKNKGRGSKIQNKIRQLGKFGELLNQDWPSNYWFLASFIDDQERNSLVKHDVLSIPKQPYINDESLKNFLLTDQTFVLPNDMLKKVDLMSMRHSLEVRTPFLDKEFVHFVNSLPDQYKYHGGKGKVLLRKACKDLLPEEIFTRSKQGFEVPLHQWISQSWQSAVKNEWFDKGYLISQDLFHFEGVAALKEKFFSPKPQESAIIMWAYIVFQNWYAKWIEKR